ncbi:hypothetical protein PILCRDRAFT_93531 [Piloderma croceum F 1598]|uniref:Uncharacterized protein n=1 Tax=Piloderma croceum (strain F 1598) TaxID=765440 RepID=A0A0C3AEP6_PILCF|nr:hypothetical protein PILCRDRAFT_93531 [Piloderma croceum F 1598]
MSINSSFICPTNPHLVSYSPPTYPMLSYFPGFPKASAALGARKIFSSSPMPVNYLLHMYMSDGPETLAIILRRMESAAELELKDHWRWTAREGYGESTYGSSIPGCYATLQDSSQVVCGLFSMFCPISASEHSLCFLHPPPNTSIFCLHVMRIIMIQYGKDYLPFISPPAFQTQGFNELCTPLLRSDIESSLDEMSSLSTDATISTAENLMLVGQPEEIPIVKLHISLMSPTSQCLSQARCSPGEKIILGN